LKHITPGSIWITGLPNTDEEAGIRDNGSGQMWSLTTRVGYVNYWTGEVVLDQKYVPKVRPWVGLLTSLGLKREEHSNINIRCEFEVSNLNSTSESIEPPIMDLTYSLTIKRKKCRK
jgi:hypothetical protein